MIAVACEMEYKASGVVKLHPAISETKNMNTKNFNVNSFKILVSEILVTFIGRKSYKMQLERAYMRS